MRIIFDDHGCKSFFKKYNRQKKIIKNLIEKALAKEDPQKPLSDEKLVNKFKEKEISISRRIISKYRKKLGIKNSYQRNQK